MTLGDVDVVHHLKSVLNLLQGIWRCLIVVVMLLRREGHSNVVGVK
jgi:hypothetical protein